MKNLFLTAIIALMAINGLYAQGKDTAQEQSEIKLELVYQKPFDEIVGPKGFPPPEIKRIIEEKSIPQEDRGWLLNNLRIEIAKKEKILYTNDGEAINLPKDLKSIAASKNLKYMVVYAEHDEGIGITEEELKKLRDERSRASTKYFEWLAKYEQADEIQKEVYKDSIVYWRNIFTELNTHYGQIMHKISRRKKYKKFICMETTSGKVLWENSDMYKMPYISDDGTVAVSVYAGDELQLFVSSIFFYNEHGQLTKKVSNLSSHSGCAGLTADGERFYITTRDRRQK
jgi:hypothetical protein